jgi:hypothetical protein
VTPRVDIVQPDATGVVEFVYEVAAGGGRPRP